MKKRSLKVLALIIVCIDVMFLSLFLTLWYIHHNNIDFNCTRSDAYIDYNEYSK